MTHRVLPVAVIGAGPAGLMAADIISAAGHSVVVLDAMPSVGRKFLLAGKGGLNLTHAEPPELFLTRFGSGRSMVAPWLADFGRAQICAWTSSLGIDTFVGTSGRVFPADMKAAPLLRAWLHRLRIRGAGALTEAIAPQDAAVQTAQHSTQGSVAFKMRHRWMGWSAQDNLLFDTPSGQQELQVSATVLALGGASWSRLGSDGAWVPLLAQRAVDVALLQPANCGFNIAHGWSDHFANRYAGQPFKSVAIEFVNSTESASDAAKSPVFARNAEIPNFARKGEFVATATGVEGSLIYAASSLLRDAIASHGQATVYLDLLPDRSLDRVLAEVSHPRGSRSLSSHLKSRLGLDGIKSAILYELLAKADMAQPDKLAAFIKRLPLTLTSARPIDEAISSAGGVMTTSLNRQLMLNQLPGVFCAGEMLDWEAPTGGYLISACLASGRWAGLGVVDYLNRTT